MSRAAWQTTYIDILIHAPSSSSGSLLRLLKSIEAADYFGYRRPHLTIELPADIDPPTWDYLENLVWPPIDWSGAPHASQVTLRHRIPRRTSTTEDASIRYVESFYPARPADSHVLVLSPHVELSPLYFHYLMYHLLEFKYSSLAPHSTEGRNLMGLSLELPYLHLNDSMVFTPPTVLRESEGSTSEPKEPTSFLWQAPNSNAALYFGDKWVEFHSFLTSRVSLDPAKAPTRAKQVSDIYPSWLEYMLELMRARGYNLLYPGLIPGQDSIATIHYEIYQPPDEYSKSKLQSTSDQSIPPLDPDEPFTIDPSEHRTKPKSHSESTTLTTNLLSVLPNSGAIPDVAELPLLSYQGNTMTSDNLETSAHSFARNFRREIGQCPIDRTVSYQTMSADDLFCDEGKVASDARGEYRDPISPYSGMRNSIITEPEVKDDSDQRQDEFAAHLKRQKGKVAPVDSGKEVKEEAEGHLARQAKKGVDAKADEAKSAGKKAEEKTVKKPPDEKKNEDGKEMKKDAATDAPVTTKREEAKGKEEAPPVKDRGW